MNQEFSGYRPGDKVVIRATPSLVEKLWGKPGVVADVNGTLERALMPGEVPVRIATVMATRIQDAETVVYLMQPEWIELVETRTHGTEAHKRGSR